MIRRPYVLLPLLAALAVLSACDANSPASSSASPAQATAPALSATGDAQALAELAASDSQADVEFEGTVTQVVVLNQNGQSKFVIAGRSVLTWWNGKTAVFVGTARGTVRDVTVGRRAHVKGVPVLRPQPAVIANEIRLVDGGGGGSTQASCAAPGAKVEVEGLITTRGPSSIRVFQQGKGDYFCQVSRGTSIRKGNQGYALGELQPGWRVHVKGDSLGSLAGACQVNAREIKVQNTQG